MPTLNYTTSVPVVRTIGEIQHALAKHGASGVGMSYEDGKPVGIVFMLTTPFGERAFALPVDVPAVHRLLTDQRQGRNGHKRNARVDNRLEQAERVAWRVIRDWLMAQLALIEAQMVSLDQVMLPYLKVDPGHTLYEAYQEREMQGLIGE
jgi:hypothetical protein